MRDYPENDSIAANDTSDASAANRMPVEVHTPLRK